MRALSHERRFDAGMNSKDILQIPTSQEVEVHDSSKQVEATLHCGSVKHIVLHLTEKIYY